MSFMQTIEDTCSIEGCGRQRSTRGWCKLHYNRWLRGGSVGPAGLAESEKSPCNVEGCDRPANARGMCKKHYMRWWSTGDVAIPDRSHLNKNSGKECSFDGCGRPAKCKTLCSAHYGMQRRGEELRPISTTQTRTLGMTLEQRFEYYAGALNERGCREWTGGINENGYGTIFIQKGRGNRLAHRVAVEIATGEPVSEGMPVHHTCANRRCVEASHLRVVEAWENTAEMLERQYYKKRIAALEAAIRSIDPDHEVLKEGK